MASIITHSIAGILFGKIMTNKVLSVRFWLFVGVCAIIPDADVVTFKLGIPYQSFWGHRGFTHSLSFAFCFGILSSMLYLKTVNPFKLKFWSWVFFFFLVTSTHTILDAMTNGGHGVAILAPFDETRYFFSWRPLEVSPLGVKRFFSLRGLGIIKSEFTYVILPLIGILISKKLFIIIFKKHQTHS